MVGYSYRFLKKYFSSSHGLSLGSILKAQKEEKNNVYFERNASMDIIISCTNRAKTV